jgi:ABC-type branched-subunit amino acid transport system ATPase component
MTLDVQHGLVVGVLGPWGAGKTPYMNLARGNFSGFRLEWVRDGENLRKLISSCEKGTLA